MDMHKTLLVAAATFACAAGIGVGDINSRIVTDGSDTLSAVAIDVDSNGVANMLHLGHESTPEFNPNERSNKYDNDDGNIDGNKYDSDDGNVDGNKYDNDDGNVDGNKYDNDDGNVDGGHNSLGMQESVQSVEGDEEGEHEHDYTFQYEIPSSYKDLHPDCAEWALEGECNADPTFMLKECVSSCVSHPDVQEYGLLQWGIIPAAYLDDDCVDSHQATGEDGEEDPEHNCRSWAEEGLCTSPNDKPFMLTQCKKSCMVCVPSTNENEENDDEDEDEEDEDHDVFNIGLGQRLPLEILSETLQVLMDTSTYLTQTVMDTSNDFYHSTRGACQNQDDYCAIWAAEGRCENLPSNDDYEWMVMNCAPVCQTCEFLDMQIRCPIPEGAVDAFLPGGDDGDDDDEGVSLNAMFERIVGERDFTEEQLEGGIQELMETIHRDADAIEIHSRPGGDAENANIIDGPWVISISNFLTEEECDYLIEVGKHLGYERSVETSTLSDGTLEEDKITKHRTSTNAWCNGDPPVNMDSNSTLEEVACRDQPMVKQVRDKLSIFTTVPTDNGEDLQLLHYNPGQFYKVHHDYTDGHEHLPSGPRILTFFLYLNDVEEGGGTRFPELAPGAPEVTIQPVKGKALLWPSVLNENPMKIDERTRHEALPVLKGEKIAANSWLHLRDEQNVEGVECV